MNELPSLPIIKEEELKELLSPLIERSYSGPIPTSPLKQINSELTYSIKQTKLQTTWLELTSNSNLFLNQTFNSNLRYFNDLFCLNLNNNSNVIEDCLNKLSLKDLLGPFRNNITQLFTIAVKLLKETQKGDIIRTNIIETLIPFLRNVLGRNYSNFSFEVMNLLAGSMERSDSVFTDLVSAIDVILQDSNAPPTLRSKTLHLSIILVASINQASLNAYFLRRDLFSTLTRYISTPATTTPEEAFNATLLLGLLSNFRKLDARNPYLARIEDFVDDFVMGIMVDVVKGVAKSGVNSGYSVVVNGASGSGIVDESKIGFVASLTSLVYGSLELLKGGFSLSLPPPVVNSRSSKGKGKEKALSQDSLGDEEKSNLKVGLGLGESESSSSAIRSSAVGSAGDVEEKDVADSLSKLIIDTPPPLPPKPMVDSISSSTKAKSSSSSEAFKSMPPEVTVILLPFYDLLNSNKAFCTVVYADTETGPAELPPAIISLSSYILCHASVSLRSRVYARLCLIILTILVEEGEGKLTVEAEEIKLCRQRLPMLPLNQGRRLPIAAVLDTALIFLRHNMHKRLDVESYIICLKLVQRVMQQLKNERVRLEYDWVAIWRSILSLSAFIVSKVDSLRIVSTQLDDLISQIFIVLSYAVFWGETFFSNTTASVLLHYELLHSDQTLTSLITLLEISSLTARKIASPILSPSPNIPRRLSINANQFYYSSTSTGPTGSSFQATECITNLRSCINFFSEELAKEKISLGNKLGSEEELEVEVVMQVIERELSRVDLAECVAMGDLRRWEELGMGQETFFKELAAVACEDAIRLVPAA